MSKISGKKLEDKVKKLFRKLGFVVFGPVKPTKIKRFKTSCTKPKEIEIDLIAKFGNIGFLIEVTSQKEKNNAKIKKLLDKHKVITASGLSKHNLMKVFSCIPKNNIDEFSKIKKWRCIYVGTSPEIIYDYIKPEDFAAQSKLKIINIDDFVYISKMIKAIGDYARYELLSYLELEYQLEGETESPFEPYVVKNREITQIGTSAPIKANIYSFAASPDYVLKVCRVPRFHGLPRKIYYQRMLTSNKLNKIRKHFIKSNPLRLFPTPITIVLPKDMIHTHNELRIPFKYGSLVLIDGQHRLYSYATLPEDVRKNSKILINAIEFHSDDEKILGRFSARTFMDINSKQTRVKTSLLYLIGYDQMGDTSNHSLAGKIIKMCNSDNKSPLHDLFQERSLGRKSRLKTKRVSIVEVSKTLSRIVRKIKKRDSNTYKNVKRLRGNKPLSTTNKAIITNLKNLINSYFKKIENVFKDDWVVDTKSLIFKTKYMAAFIILLDKFIDSPDLIDYRYIETELTKIKSNIKLISKWRRSARLINRNERKQIFHIEREAIVPIKYGTNIIANSLIHYRNKKIPFNLKKIQ